MQFFPRHKRFHSLNFISNYESQIFIWEVKQRHEIPGLPSQYLFLLVCCSQQGCPHPLCQAGRGDLSGGPSLHLLPFPLPDPSRPWGSSSCEACSGFCAGHFLKPENVSDAPPMMKPPSSILKQYHQNLKGCNPSEDELKEMAQKVLCPKRGAAKAAETRRRKFKSSANYYCGVCGALFGDSEESEYWIGCEGCDEWFHGECVNITKETEPNKFFGFACIV